MRWWLRHLPTYLPANPPVPDCCLQLFTYLLLPPTHHQFSFNNIKITICQSCSTARTATSNPYTHCIPKHELAPQSFGDLAKEEYRNISHNAAHPPPQPQPAVGPDNIWGRLYNSCPISFTVFVIGFIATTVFTPCAIWVPQLFRSAAPVCDFVTIWACLSCRRYHRGRSATEHAGDVPLREIDVIGSTLPELVSLISDLKDLYASLPCMTLIADQFSKLLWFTVG